MGVEPAFFTTFGGRIKIRPTNMACWDFGEGIDRATIFTLGQKYHESQ